MRILVTGHLGFVGSYLLPVLEGHGHEVMGIDVKEGQDVALPKKLGWPQEVKRFDPEIVYHLAAKHYVPWCREHPAETRMVNERGTNTLLLSLFRTSVRVVVLASSAAIYGFGSRPFKETAAYRPIDVYGQTKVVNEKMLRQFGHEKRITTVAARLSNVIGPGDSHPHLLPVLMAGGDIKLGNLWPLRDYIYAGDVAHALHLMASLQPGFHAINVSTGRGTSPLQLAEYAGISGPDWEPGRPDDGDLVLDPRKMLRTLNYEALTTIPEVIEQWT